MSLLLLALIIISIIAVLFFVWYANRKGLFGRVYGDIASGTKKLTTGRVFIRNLSDNVLQIQDSGQVVVSPENGATHTLVISTAEGGNVSIRSEDGRYIGAYPDGKIWASSKTVDSPQLFKPIAVPAGWMFMGTQGYLCYNGEMTSVSTPSNQCIFTVGPK